MINKEIFDAFRSDAGLRAGLRKSFERMSWFYGFYVKDEEDGKVTVSLFIIFF